MSKPQFATREGWLICPECEGRSFSDPLKAYHYPECPRYKEWRFGKNVVGGSGSGPAVARQTPAMGPENEQHAPTTSELISDKVMDSVLEDLWREVEGSDEW